MTLRVNLEVPSGATWSSPTWALLDENGQSLPVPGWVVRAQVRARTDDEAVLFTWGSAGAPGTLDADVVVEPVEIVRVGTDPLTTVGVTLHLTDEQSAALTFSAGVFDVLAGLENGESYRIAEGSIRVTRGVTR